MESILDLLKRDRGIPDDVPINIAADICAADSGFQARTGPQTLKKHRGARFATGGGGGDDPGLDDSDVSYGSRL
jgi:hypothetical protein